MLRNNHRKPLSLPLQLRQELNIQDKSSGGRRGGSLAGQRKQQRKAFRIQKRSQKSNINGPTGKPRGNFEQKRSKYSKKEPSIRKPEVKSRLPSTGDDDDDDDDGNDEVDLEDEENEIDEVIDDDEDLGSASSIETSSDPSSSPLADPEPRLDRAVRDKLADEDAQIAALEKKLGKRSKSKSNSKGGRGDLGGLLDELGDLGGYSGSDDEMSTSELDSRAKRKNVDLEAQEWLQSKRLKTKKDEGFDSFEGFEESDDDVRAKSPLRARENPYVAPTTAKYIPPSLRAQTQERSFSDEERLRGLRRQVQGLLNRLSEANVIDIVKRTDAIFQKNPRNDVASVLIDLLVSLLSDRAALNDTFIILHAAFTAALYRVVGIDFGAKIIQEMVERCGSVNGKGDQQDHGKTESNLISFLAELYNFQVVGSQLIYGFLRILISDLSEHSTELLLRVVRSSGQQLRQDDPSSLKDLVVLLQESVKRVDESSLSVRTKFMIETITNLRNNRKKTGQEAASIRTEHTVRMKKTLASMNSVKGLPIKATEPIRVSLEDIQNSQTKGKWWLVGASYRDNAQLQQQQQNGANLRISETSSSGPALEHQPMAEDGINEDGPDILTAARSLGMNNDVRRAIFVAIMTSASLDHAFVLLKKLTISKKQTKEIALVLARCVAAEGQYNPFYAMLAKKVGRNQREVRKSLWNPLLEVLTQLEEEDENEMGGEDDEDDGPNRWWAHPQARYNLARFFGILIAEDVVPILVLKNRDLIGAGPAASAFLELLLIAVMVTLGRHSSKVQHCFDALRDTQASITMRVFLEKTVMNSDLAAPREEKTVRFGCRAAIKALQEN